ncbi:MAG: hypothetical protein OEY81_03535 [Candidatus Bathyarchaeota archaeon]|nr:hypothetical protein [Candidatus Bathyarchaeota archaeon]
MSEEKSERKKGMGEAEEVREILGVVSTQIPALIRGVVGAVFSEEAGKDMGRAAGAFYKELRESGMPEDVAVKMTQNYIGVFTSLGDMLKEAVSGKGKRVHINVGKEGEEEIGEEIARKIKEKIAEKTERE